MNRIPYPHAHPWRDRHGRVRWRFRKGNRTVYLSGAPGDPGFLPSYEAALTGRSKPKATVTRIATGASPRSLRAAWIAYVKASPEWKQAEECTRIRDGRIADAFLQQRVVESAPDTWGEMVVADLKRRHLKAIVAGMSDRPHAARRWLLGKEQHSARRSWVYIDGEVFQGARDDIAGDAKEPWVNIAWKYLYTAKDSWLGSEANLGSIGATYNLTMDPYEKYDMTFNGAAPTRVLSTSPGKYAGQDNGWVLALVEPVIADFDKTIMKFPNTRRFVGGASNDLVPNLQNPDNPVPLLKEQIEKMGEPHTVGGGG